VPLSPPTPPPPSTPTTARPVTIPAPTTTDQRPKESNRRTRHAADERTADLEARLSNPPDNFGQATSLLATMLGRPEPSRLPEQAGLQPQHRLLPWETEALVEGYNEGFSIERRGWPPVSG